MQAIEMIRVHPHVMGNVNDALVRCIDECYACGMSCNICADACLGEEMLRELTQCIRLNNDCADVCLATGALSARRTGSDEELIRRMLDACVVACRNCGEECRRHADMHEHCRVCAEHCERCEEACRSALKSMH